MPDTPYPTGRDLGTSVPVAEVLDPRLWRERYAYGLPIGGPTDAQLAADAQADQVAAALAKCAVAQRAAGEAWSNSVFRRFSDTIPDRVIVWHLRAALSLLETRLGVPMGIERIVSEPLDEGLVQGVDYDRSIGRLPYTTDAARSWFRLDLSGPILSIQRVRAYFWGQQVWEWSPQTGTQDLVRVEWRAQGVCHIIPTNLSAVLAFRQETGIIGWGPAMAFLTYAQSPLPDVWAVDYTRGPMTRDGQPGRIEATLADWCYAVAGQTLLSLDGMRQSRGLSSSSVSMDGVSRSVSLTASAIYGLNSALEEKLKQAEERIDWKRLRTYKQGLRVMPLGF